MVRRLGLVVLMVVFAGVFGFAQAGALRDYVGLISIRYHSDAVTYMGKYRDSFERRGYSDAAKSIDNYLKGLSGSGFVYVAGDGASYILTNEHVVAQSETLSVTFEKLDGSKTTWEHLRVLYVDEEKDLALLGFDAGVKPFERGLALRPESVEEGSDVFAAGFPGLGNTAIWQFSRGAVSNALARLPKSNDSDETIGPYIQHTAQVDPGNSGGPLLAADSNAPAGYAVVGINTLSVFERQAANYAIPARDIEAFLGRALGGGAVNERELIALKVDDFLKGLKANRAVYGHIAGFLSNACTASNAEYAISELLERAPVSVLENIDAVFANNPVEGMNAAVAWYIESSMRSKTGSMSVSLDSINPNERGFSVSFKVNGESVASQWVKEYGIYRMDTFGDSVTGDKSLLEEKQRKREQEKSLVTEYDYAVTAGYAYVIDYGSAFTAAILFNSPVYTGVDVAVGQKGYFSLGLDGGYAFPIRMDSFALMPFGELGMKYISTDASKAAADAWEDDSPFGFAFGLSLKAGLMFTTAKVPGLFGRAFFNYNIAFLDSAVDNTSVLGIAVGYGF